MIEDRSAHINGSRLDQQNEINQIATYLFRESKAINLSKGDDDKGKDKLLRTEPLSFSIAALQKAILLPSD
jgi:hypothetical protein